jgi:exosortase
MDALRSKLVTPDLKLAALRKDELMNLLMGAGLIGIFFLTFHYFGNSQETYGAWGRSAFHWLTFRWSMGSVSLGNGDYSHGYLIPAFSVLVLWRKRHEIQAAPKKAAPIFLAAIVASLLLHYLGLKTQQTRISLFGMIGLLWSIPGYLYGWKLAWLILFPCAFLIFGIPLELFENMTLPLRFINTEVAVSALQGLGIEVRQVGTAIYGPPYDATAELKLDVADACSGIRSITAMTALAAGYGYLVMNTLWSKWLIFLSSIPLAMAGNMFRIIAIGIIAEAFGTDVAAGVIHDYSGFLVFGMAIALMVALSTFLNRIDSRVLPRYIKKVPSCPNASASI